MSSDFYASSLGPLTSSQDTVALAVNPKYYCVPRGQDFELLYGGCMDATFAGENRRRSSRLPLSIPVFVTGKNTIVHVHSHCETLDVSSTGVRLRSKRLLPFGASIRLDVLGGNGIAMGTVVRVIPARDSYDIGVKFDEPANIWNIKNPPSDWRPPMLKLRDS